LQTWRANCDLQLVTDYYACLEYLAKYASKAEKMSQSLKDAFSSVVNSDKNKNDLNGQFVKRLMMKGVGQRDMGIQEVMHLILSNKLCSSSFQVITMVAEKLNLVNKRSRQNPQI